MYDRDGAPIDMLTFDRLLRDGGYRIVEQTDVGPFWISTVWLGIDYRFGGHGAPLIFETMVFGNDDGAHDLSFDFDCRRYSTEAEARDGHAATVLLVQATIGLDEGQDIQPHNGRDPHTR